MSTWVDWTVRIVAMPAELVDFFELGDGKLVDGARLFRLLSDQ